MDCLNIGLVQVRQKTKLNRYLIQKIGLFSMERFHLEVPNLKMNNPLKLYVQLLLQCKNLQQTLCLKNPLGPKQMKINILKFCFHFCLQYALIIAFYDFNLSFLKIMLKSTLNGLLQDKVYLTFSTILEQNDYPLPIQAIPVFPF